MKVGTFPMNEKREIQRRRMKAGVICIGDKSTIDCVVRDLAYSRNRRPAPKDMRRMWPMSRRVNWPGNDADAKLIGPIYEACALKMIQ
jgi:hypothetical protein